MDLIVALIKFSASIATLYLIFRITIGDYELRKTDFGWRADWLGRALGIHATSAHVLGRCWCQKGK